MIRLFFLFFIFTFVGCGNHQWPSHDSYGVLLPNTSSPKLTVDPEFGLAFDCVTLGCKQSRAITISNREGGVILIHRIELANNSSADFSLIKNPGTAYPTQPISIRSGESIEIPVQYQPSDSISDNGFLLVDWQVESSSTVTQTIQRKTIPIRTRMAGEKSAKGLDSSLNFGYVPIHEQKVIYFPIENTSTGNTIVSIIAMPTGPIVNGSHVFTAMLDQKLHLNPGQKTKIPISFSPKEEGVFEGDVTFLVEGSPAPRIVAHCLGTSIGKAKITAIDPKENLIDFGTQNSGTIHQKFVTIRNEGSASTTLNVLVDSEPKNSFILEEIPAQNELLLSPMETVTLSLLASPKTGGKHKGLLHIEPTSDKQASIKVPLSIFSLAPRIRLSQKAMDFSSIALSWESDTRYVQIDNDGVGTLIIDAITLSPESSSLLSLSEIPTLPIRLSPGDPPIKIGVKLLGLFIGDVQGQIQIHNNSTEAPLLSVNIQGQVQTCNEQCHLLHSDSSCIRGKCEIAKCDPGWHDADIKSTNGCECREDFQTKDIGDTCSDGLQMGVIGDACSAHEQKKEYKGTLHNKKDVDLFFIRAKDAGSLFCDIFGDSFEASISLLSAPPGLVLCTNIQAFGSGCGGYRHEFDPNICGQTHRINPGHYSGDDSCDITAWVMWHPDAEPICGEYTISFRGKK